MSNTNGRCFQIHLFRYSIFHPAPPILFSLFLIISFFHSSTSQPLQMALETDKNQITTLIFKDTINPDIQRFQTLILKKNKNMIDESNADPYKTYKLEVNAFAKFTQKQIKRKYLNLIPSSPASINFVNCLIGNLRKGNNKINNISNIIYDNENNSQNNVENINISSNNRGRLLEQIEEQKQNTINKLNTYEKQVLEEVKQFFKKKNISDDDIDTKIISKYKYNGNNVDLKNVDLKSVDLKTVDLKNVGKKRLLSMDNNTLLTTQYQQINQTQIGNTSLSKSYDVDWTCLSGRVRAQGDCGACYAFVPVDNVGAILGIYYYTFFIQLSIQEIIDCTKNSLTFGCNGGFLQGAFVQMVNPGIVTQYLYPYQSLILSGSNGQKYCKTAIQKYPKFRIQRLEIIQKNNCMELKQQLLKHPISVGITGYKLAFYKEGIFDGCDGNDDLDHAVLVIGFKEGKGWKIKNSWGVSWGESGYGWIKDGNTCRICQMGIYPVPTVGKGYEEYVGGKMEKICPLP